MIDCWLVGPSKWLMANESVAESIMNEGWNKMKVKKNRVNTKEYLKCLWFSDDVNILNNWWLGFASDLEEIFVVTVF